MALQLGHLEVACEARLVVEIQRHERLCRGGANRKNTPTTSADGRTSSVKKADEGFLQRYPFPFLNQTPVSVNLCWPPGRNRP